MWPKIEQQAQTTKAATKKTNLNKREKMETNEQGSILGELLYQANAIQLLDAHSHLFAALLHLNYHSGGKML